MSDRPLRLAIGSSALIGAGLAAYLVYVRHAEATLICASGGCETVQASRYAEIAGVPVALMGLAGYLVIFATALGRGELVRLAQASFALAAFLFSAYLLYVQIRIIGALCYWCLASDAVTTGIAVLALLRLRSGSRTAAKELVRL